MNFEVWYSGFVFVDFDEMVDFSELDLIFGRTR